MALHPRADRALFRAIGITTAWLLSFRRINGMDRFASQGLRGGFLFLRRCDVFSLRRIYSKSEKNKKNGPCAYAGRTYTTVS